MRSIAVRRLFQVVNGGTPTSAEENWDGGVQWATPVDLAVVNGGIITETQRTLSVKGLSTGSREVPAGSLIVSTRAPIGYVAETSQPTAMNQGCRGLVPSTDLDIRFYRYAIGASAEQLNSLGQGSTFVELSTSALAALEVPHPPVHIQRAIADYLDAETAHIDALLMKKRRMQALSEERLGVLVGDVFARWKHVPLKRIAKRVDVGIAEAATQAYADVGTPLIRSTNIRREGLDTSDLLYIDPSFAEKNRSKYVHAGDILTVRTGNVGVSAVVPPEFDNCQCFTQLIVTLGEDQIPEVICAALNYGRARQYFEMTGWGSAQDNISVPLLANAPVPLIPLIDQPSVSGSVACAIDQMTRLNRILGLQSQVLLERRQALITEAVTGQLEIQGATA